VLETRLHEPDARRASRRPAAHRAAPAEPATVRAEPATVRTAAVTDAGGGAVRLRALDGLRLLVALMVAFFHYLGEDQSALAWGKDATRIFPDVDYLAPYGWLGVEIFFMISGFVICMSSRGRCWPCSCSPGCSTVSSSVRSAPSCDASWAGPPSWTRSP
jgi:hypothetical protein